LEIAGSDVGIALSAWTSTSRDLDDRKIARVPALLARLLRDGHHTPFEKAYLRFLVLVDDATHIHLLKHRIGVSVNAESARYKELSSDAFYIPPDWPQEERAAYAAHARAAFVAYHQTLARLEAAGLSRKRAKESARYYLPKGAQLTLDIAFNWRSFLHFLSLRDTPHAQKEVREVAAEMLRQVEASGRFPITCRLARAYLALHGLLDAAMQTVDLLTSPPSRVTFDHDPKADAAEAPTEGTAQTEPAPSQESKP
jgi:flavin-dependent thymidylate synthase